ncbi:MULTISPECIES: MBOAT family O-acyltransferase [unclassified Desulfovibrio]|nr:MULTISPECIES: MBOAT family O-acyltransferase [unclassified Desulfovibrio]
MFPQLVAGPIVRYSEIAGNLGERSPKATPVADGCRRFIYGLAKKCLLADTFGKIADACFDIPPATLSGEAAWLGMLCYSLQIFFDFSAYSDMAIGMGHMLGFTFPENFNAPYLARSVREFWQRWHMSLTRWLRDYLYIPLGGNRISQARTCLNMMVVFLACGLWHGASANFLLWGAYFGCFLVLERLAHNRPMAPVVGHAYTMLVVMAGWVLFRAPDLGSALGYYKALAFMNGVALVENVDVLLAFHGYYPKIALGCAVFLILLPALPKPAFLKRAASPVLLGLEYLWALALLYVSTMMIFGATHRYFIYFRF